MKKVDYEKKCAAFNTIRMQNQNKTLTREEFIKLMSSIGINQNIINLIIRFNYVMSERVGVNKLYSFKSVPLYKAQLESLYRKDSKSRNKKENISEEEQALNLLQSKGYQIKVCKGFDELRFKKDHPDLYQKYLIYETL